MNQKIKIFKPSKFGVKKVTIDIEDFNTYQNSTWYIWSTERHSSYYLMRSTAPKGETQRFHRLITNCPKDYVIDHIDGDALNNCKDNLRITTQAKNNRNAKPYTRAKTKTSIYKGVHKLSEGKWKAQIQINGAKKILGTYNTEKEAAEVYNNAAIKYFKEYAVLNKI